MQHRKKEKALQKANSYIVLELKSFSILQPDTASAREKFSDQAENCWDPPLCSSCKNSTSPAGKHCLPVKGGIHTNTSRAKSFADQHVIKTLFTVLCCPIWKARCKEPCSLKTACFGKHKHLSTICIHVTHLCSA